VGVDASEQTEARRRMKEDTCFIVVYKVGSGQGQGSVEVRCCVITAKCCRLFFADSENI
jgi:hypothetical protein